MSGFKGAVMVMARGARVDSRASTSEWIGRSILQAFRFGVGVVVLCLLGLVVGLRSARAACNPENPNEDSDGDMIPDCVDNCSLPNPGQGDYDEDGYGDGHEVGDADGDDDNSDEAVKGIYLIFSVLFINS